MKTTLKTAKFTFKTAFARCVAANAVVVSCIFVAKVAKWLCDCGMFCCSCGGFYVLFRWLRCLFAVKIWCKMAKLWCENGKMYAVFGGLMIDCGGCVVRFGRFQPWFPEFHKAFHSSHLHFTANQHIISTFSICQNRLTGTRTGENNVKNRLTHVQKRWKPHSKQQNSHSKQCLRGALRRKFCAVAAVSWLIAACSVVLAAVSMCFSGVCKVYLRQKCGAETAKLWCGNGENMVRKRWNAVRRWWKWWCIFGVYMLDFLYFGCQGGEMVVRFRLKFIVLRRLRGAFRAFPTMISRISQSIPQFSPPFYSKSTHYINIFHLPKPPYRHSNRRKQC